MSRSGTYRWRYALLMAWLCALCLRSVAAEPPKPDQPAQPALVFDADLKEVEAKIGDLEVNLTFAVTNRSNAEVVVSRVDTSCGCTVAKLPSEPWHIAPGASGNIEFNIDLRGKSGLLTKSANVVSSAGSKVLILRVKAPSQPAPVAIPASRANNIVMAMNDRQTVFKGDCAKCHLQPGIGKNGEELFKAVCTVCHDTPNRASMVPDLYTLKHPTDETHWTIWVKYGKVNTLMPAFAQSEGGPLTDSQVSSLVYYLSHSTNFVSNKLTATTSVPAVKK